MEQDIEKGGLDLRRGKSTEIPDDASVPESETLPESFRSMDITGIIQICVKNFEEEILVPALIELTCRVGKEDIAALEDKIARIASNAEDCRNNKIHFRLYRLLSKMLDLTENRSLRKVIIVFLITRLALVKHDFILDIIEKAASEFRNLFFTAIRAYDCKELKSETLSSRETIKFIEFLPLSEGRVFYTWPESQKAIARAIVSSGLKLSMKELTELFCFCIDYDDMQASFADCMEERNITASDFINKESPFSGIISPRRFVQYLIDLYCFSAGEMKKRAIRWLGETSLSSATGFLMYLYENGEDSSEEILEALIANSELIIDRIMKYYGKDPRRCSLLLQGISFDLDTIRNDIVGRHPGSLKPETVTGVMEAAHECLYRNEEAEGSDYFLYCAYLKASQLLEHYSPVQCRRLCGLLRNIYDAGKRMFIFDTFSVVDILSLEPVCHYLLSADFREIKNFNNNIRKGIPLQKAGEKLLGHRGTSFNIGSPDDRNRIYHDIQDKISRNDFELACSKVRKYIIPPMPVDFPVIRIRGRKNDSLSKDNCIHGQDLFSTIRDPDRSTRVLKSIQGGRVLGRRNTGRITAAMKRLCGKHPGKEDNEPFLVENVIAKAADVYKTILPVILDEIATERKQAALDTLFDIFLDYFGWMNPDFNCSKISYREIPMYVKRQVTPLVLQTEDAIYAGYFRALKKRHCDMLIRVLNYRMTCIDHADRVSDLRNIYSMRKHLLSREIRKGRLSKIDKQSASKEISAIGKLSREFFLLETFLNRMFGQRVTDHRSSGSIMLEPAKDHFLVFRSHAGRDCNEYNISQAVDQDSIFFRIFHNGKWKGYVCCILLRKRGVSDALLIDVLNMVNVPVRADLFLDSFISQLSLICRKQGIGYILSSSRIGNFSNREYIQIAAAKYYTGNTISNQWKIPSEEFQSAGKKFNVIWEDDAGPAGC